MDFGSIPFVASATPAPPPGGGTAAWESVSVSASGTSLSPAAPSGLVSADWQLAVLYGVRSDDTYSAPAGWTSQGSVHTGFFGNLGVDVWSAPGSTAQGTWTFTTSTVLIEIHRVSGSSGVRSATLVEASSFTWDGGSKDIGWPDMPSPSAATLAGDAVIAITYNPQIASALTTPATDYTRASARTSPTRQGSMYRSNAPAGTTGELLHGSPDDSYQARATGTIVMAAA